MAESFLGSDQVAAEQGLHGGVISGNPAQFAGTGQIGAAVADVPNPGLGSHSVLLNQGQHDGRSHLPIWEVRRVGGGDNAFVDARRSLANRLVR